MATQTPQTAPNARANPERKPWTPPATQKTDLERSISQLGAPVPESLKDNDDDSQRREKRLLSGGPNGPAVLDRFGYRISYAKVKKSGRKPPRPMPMAALEKQARESERIEELMGVPVEMRGKSGEMYFRDQVARDLDIPYHTVGMPEYEEWNRRGCRMDPRLWEERPSREDMERLFALMTGCAFRV